MSVGSNFFRKVAAVVVLTIAPFTAATAESPPGDLTGSLWFGHFDDTGLKAFEFREDGVLAAYFHQYSRGAHPLAEVGTWQWTDGAVKAQIEDRNPEYNRYFEASVVNGRLVGTVRGETPGRQYIESTVVDGKPVNTIRDDPPSPWTKDFSFTFDQPCVGERLICDNRIFCVDPEQSRSLRQIPGLTAPPADGVEDFDRFQATFFCAAEMGLVEDYAERIRFPLPVTRRTWDPDKPWGPGNPGTDRLSVNRSVFSKEHVYGQENRPRRMLAPFGAAFAGAGERVTYLDGILLTFGRSDGHWMLVETRFCGPGACPKVMCGELVRRRAFPGRGPDGNEDFDAFFETFYCDTQALWHRSTEDRDDTLIQSRVRYPLRSRFYSAYEGGEPEEAIIERERTGVYFLYGHDSGDSPPRIRIEGDEAYVTVHSIASSMSTTGIFKRIDGLWYLVGTDASG